MVIPLEELRKMLEKLEDEDCARHSGTVEGQGGNQPSTIQLEEMD